MAKIDKSNLTKEEWHKLREERKKEKDANQLRKAMSKSGTFSKDAKNYILCLKHGTKYNCDYVNKLYKGVSKNCTIPFEFVCLTEDARGIHEDIKILPLPDNLEGWWCKPYIFSNDLPLNGTILYMDLDVIIADNIDKLFTWQPGRWCTVRDFTRAMQPRWQKYNSSIVRFEKGDLDFVWTDFDKDRKSIQRRYFGDQDWLYAATHQVKGAMLYPDSWIQSWKWEVRTEPRNFRPGGIRGARKLARVDNNARPRVECCVTVFHGDPNPEHCEDKWVVDNWHKLQYIINN